MTTRKTAAQGNLDAILGRLAEMQELSTAQFDKLDIRMSQLEAANQRSPSMASALSEAEAPASDEEESLRPLAAGGEQEYAAKVGNSPVVPMYNNLNTRSPEAPFSKRPLPRTHNIRAVPRTTTNGVAICNYEDLTHEPAAPLVMVADSHHFKTRLHHLSVETLYAWLSAVYEYEHSFSVRINRVAFVDLAVLRILSRDIYGDPLDTGGAWSWTNSSLKDAMITKLGQQTHTPYTLCQVARRNVHYPVLHHAERDRIVDRATKELSVVPVYLSNLRQFEVFCAEYNLLSDDQWPKEDNPLEPGPIRLHEVARHCVETKAPLAWSVLRAPFHAARRLSFSQLVAGVRQHCTSSISRLSNGADMFHRLLDVRKGFSSPSQPAAYAQKLTPGADRRQPTTTPRLAAQPYQQGSGRSPEQAGPPAKALRINNIDLNPDSDCDSDQGSWRDAPDADDASLHDLDDQEVPLDYINAIQDVAKKDKSQQACHGFIFNPSGCQHIAAGKKCPFSHDLDLCMKEADAAKARLLQQRLTK